MHHNWLSLIQPKGLVVDRDSLTAKYGRFIVEPLERGYGVTLGNALRRILLSSLQGSAIAAVKIDGAGHEFSALPDIREDGTDIVLNLKEVRVKLHGAQRKVVHISATGPCEVRAGDIQCDNTVEILSPDQYICTVAAGGTFKAELTIDSGRGYVAAGTDKNHEYPVGTVQIDALYSPVHRVNYNVTNARVGQTTDYDKLVLEVWTNGSVQPEDAVGIAAKILKEQLNIFINFPEEIAPEFVDLDKKEDRFNENLLRSVDELELSVRSANCLQNANIKTVGELVQKTEIEMLRTKNFGRKSLKEIREILGEMGLSLGMNIKAEGHSKS